MLLCAQCGLAAHSWCLYERGSRAEDAAIEKGDTWLCHK
mgnify:CR=1 FL=1|jgi:hypothetical protein